MKDDEHDELADFVLQSRRKINRLIVDKLKLLGVTLENLREEKDKYAPLTTVIEDGDMVIEEYSVMGLHLLTVQWQGKECRVIHPERDETY